MPAATVLILAAGQGTRMRSATPKVLHPVCGRPMILWPVLAAREAGAGRIVVVQSPGHDLGAVLPEGVQTAVQPEANGTGGAVAAAADHVDRDAPVLILMGDDPLVTAEDIAQLVQGHEPGEAQATVVTMILEDPTGYGRVVRDAGGDVERIVETKHAGDATPDELDLNEINTGIYAFDGAALLDALPQLRSDNAQGEFYLPDVLAYTRPVAGHLTEARPLGVNDRADLATVTALARRRINVAHMRNGVTLEDPETTYIEAGVELGRDTVVAPGCSLLAGTTAGEHCRIGPHTTLAGSTLGDRVTVLQSYVTGAELHDGVTVGPFAYLRPGAILREGAKAGTFVEIKNSDIGEGSKVPHLSYIGDADVGAKTNLGAATITANYDGRTKHRTTIGANVRTSVDTTLVAPVALGDDAYTGAGSVITEDVPAGALGIARERQRNIAHYADRRSEDRPGPPVDSPGS